MAKKNTIGYVRIIVLVLLSLIFYGGAMGIYGMTIVNPVWVIIISVMVAAMSGVVLWRLWPCVTGSERFVWNFICQTLFAAGLLMFVFFAGNYFLPSRSDAHQEKVIVEKVYSEERYRSKRVGRRYVRGEPYKVYYMQVEFQDGRRKDLSITPGKAARLHKGDPLTLNVRKGFLGVPVIDFCR